MVVSLYSVRLENVWIDGSLTEELYPVKLCSLFRKHIYEFLTDDLTLRFRIRYARKLIQKSVYSIHVYEIGIHLIPEHLDDLLGFTFSKQPVINMNTYKVLSDRLYKKRSHNGRINSAGKCEQHFLITDLLLYRSYLVADEALSCTGILYPF